jgi:hypothetical protein
MVDGSNSSVIFAARWISSSVCMSFAPVIGGVGIAGGRMAWTITGIVGVDAENADLE